jgi:hypothetical protein
MLSNAAGAMLAVVMLGVGERGGPPPPAQARVVAVSKVLIHSVRGVVRMVSPSSITITIGPRARPRTMTFTVTPLTLREGQVEVGTTASIRYRTDGSRLIMIAVSTQPERRRGSHVSAAAAR